MTNPEPYADTEADSDDVMCGRLVAHGEPMKSTGSAESARRPWFAPLCRRSDHHGEIPHNWGALSALGRGCMCRCHGPGGYVWQRQYDGTLRAPEGGDGG